MDAPGKPTPAQIMCPHLKCRKILSIPADVRGMTVRCQHCQNLLRVPDGSKPKASAA